MIIFNACICSRLQTGEEWLSEVIEFENLKSGFNPLFHLLYYPVDFSQDKMRTDGFLNCYGIPDYAEADHELMALLHRWMIINRMV